MSDRESEPIKSFLLYFYLFCLPGPPFGRGRPTRCSDGHETFHPSFSTIDATMNFTNKSLCFILMPGTGRRFLPACPVKSKNETLLHYMPSCMYQRRPLCRARADTELYNQSSQKGRLPKHFN
jgi:hypothetical protein